MTRPIAPGERQAKRRELARSIAASILENPNFKAQVVSATPHEARQLMKEIRSAIDRMTAPKKEGK